MKKRLCLFWNVGVRIKLLSLVMTIGIFGCAIMLSVLGAVRVSALSFSPARTGIHIKNCQIDNYCVSLPDIM